MKSNIKMGWSEVSITPEKRVSLAGQFYERISEGVETPITATAFALETDDDAFIICSADLASVSSDLVSAVRCNLTEISDLPIDKIIISATHTHASHLYHKGDGHISNVSSTMMSQFVPEDMLYKPRVTVDDSIITPSESFDFLAVKIALAIKEAWENRTMGAYAPGFGRAAVGMCRRVCFDDGHAEMWGDTNSRSFTALEGGNDNGIEMLFTFDLLKKLTGVILNIACPAQVMEHRNVISSDYWGKVKHILREKFGEDVYVLGLCSASGDQCPRDMIRWQNGETPVFDPNIKRPNYIERRSDGSMFDIQGTWRIGRRIASEVFYAFDEIEGYISYADLVHKTELIELPLRRVTPAEYQNAKRQMEKFVDKNKGGSFDYNDTAAMHVYSGTMARYEEQKNCDLVRFEAHFIRLGDIAFATNPFELFLDYGNRIRARSLAKQTFLIQLACGSLAYLPTEKAEKGSHYSAYVSSGRVGHIGGDLLVRKTLSRINSFFNE